MEVMSHVHDNEFSLSCVDPPYGIGVNSMNMGGRQTITPDKRTWDDEIPTPQYFDELRRVSKNQIIWGGNYFPLPQSRCFIVWDKGASMYGRSFAECEQAWVSFDKSARIFKKNPMQLDRIHPTQKPVELYTWIMENYTNSDENILDTHLGSGSSAIAAIKMDRVFIGVELDPDYYAAACKRISPYKKRKEQQKRFGIIMPVGT